MDKRLQILDEWHSIFNNVQMSSVVNPSILTKLAVRLIDIDFKTAIQEGPSYLHLWYLLEIRISKECY